MHRGVLFIGFHNYHLSAVKHVISVVRAQNVLPQILLRCWRGPDLTYIEYFCGVVGGAELLVYNTLQGL